MGSGSAWVATLLEGRYFIWSEQEKEYYSIAKDRCRDTLSGVIQYRDDKPVYEPTWNLSVARKPDNFKF